MANLPTVSEPTDAPKRRGGNPNMRPGAPSLNPKGRPRVGESLAEAVRARFSPESIVDLADKLTRAEDERVRFAAVQFLAERGYGKILNEHAIDVNPSGTSTRDWSKVPLEERRALLEKMRSVPVLADGGDSPIATPTSGGINP